MSNEFLNSLLKEYEQKKLTAELNLEKRKETLYKDVPRLQKIEDNLNNFAIMTAKNILNNSSYPIDQLEDEVNKLKLEKSEILKNLNLPDNYLEPNYDCKICKDTGYIKLDNYKTSMCNCLKQKLLECSFNKSNMYNLDKQNFNNFNEDIFSDEVDLSKCKLNISPRQNILNIKNKCIEFIENFDNPNQKNLLFTGKTGLR